MQSVLETGCRTQPFDRIRELLPRWASVPIYQDRSPRLDDIAALDCPRQAFSALPYVTKHEMRANFPMNFLPPGQELESLLDQQLVELEFTSGTSEERVPVLLGREWWGIQEADALRRNGFVAHLLDEFPEAKRATLTTPNCNGLICDSAARQRSERTHGSTLYVNRSRIPFVQEESELTRMAQEIAEWSPLFLDLDPVHGAWFALYCERHGIHFPSLQFIVVSYEFVSVVHRRILERVFQVPVFNLYGSTETGHLLMEDGQGCMQANPDHAYLEIVDADARGVGDLVVTTLSNEYMPLLRYRIGDLVEMREDGAIVHGRHRDALRAADGQRVTTWDVDQCFVGVEGVMHYQLRRAMAGGTLLRLVPDGDGPSLKSLGLLVSRLSDLLGGRQSVEVERVEMLPPTPSGKYRLTLRV